MMPRLLAEESIRRVNEIALASGRLKKHEAQALQRRWQREAAAHVPRPATRTNVWGGLADMPGGPKVVLVPVKADG